MKKQTQYLLLGLAAVAVIFYLRKKKDAAAATTNTNSGGKGGDDSGPAGSRSPLDSLLGSVLNGKSGGASGNVFTNGVAAGLLNRTKSGGGGGGGGSTSLEGFMDVGGIVTAVFNGAKALVSGAVKVGKAVVDKAEDLATTAKNTEIDRFAPNYRVNRALDALGLNDIPAVSPYTGEISDAAIRDAAINRNTWLDLPTSFDGLGTSDLLGTTDSLGAYDFSPTFDMNTALV